MNNHSLSFDDVVHQTGIEHLLNRQVTNLSGGEKQRVSIARTLLNAPSLLLMDEPLASLDWPSKLKLIPCLKQIQQQFGIPIIMVSHSRDEMARLADSLLILDKGNVLAKGDCHAFINHCSADDTMGQSLSVLDGVIKRQDTQYALSEIQVDQHVLLVSQINQPEGSQVRLVVPAHEVSLVIDQLTATSIQNRLPVKVSKIERQGHHHALISLSLGQQTLLAQITRKSLDTLKLSVGQRVLALFKAAGLQAN